jgi:flagellar biosynthesis chaperone FliJ
MAGRFSLLLTLMKSKEQEVLELLGEVTRQWQQDIDKKQELIGFRYEYLQQQAEVGLKSSVLMKKNAHFIGQLEIAIEQQDERINLHQQRRQQVLALYSSIRGKRQLFEKLVERDRQQALVLEEKKIQQAVTDISSRIMQLKHSFSIS